MQEIIMLNLKFKFGAIEGEVFPVVLKDENNLVLIDCGYVGYLANIEQAMKEKGLSCEDLTFVVITHHDHDHMGTIADLKTKYPQIKVVASEIEAPYISGELKSLRLAQAEAMQDLLPDDQKAFGQAFCNVLKNFKTENVDVKVKDGDVLDWCGGCKIIATPGHTPGHISIFVEKLNTIIAGDAVALSNGVPTVANPEYALNLEAAQQSLEKVLNYGANEIICYHGGRYLK